MIKKMKMIFFSAQFFINLIDFFISIYRLSIQLHNICIKFIFGDYLIEQYNKVREMKDKIQEFMINIKFSCTKQQLKKWKSEDTGFKGKFIDQGCYGLVKMQKEQVRSQMCRLSQIQQVGQIDEINLCKLCEWVNFNYQSFQSLSSQDPLFLHILFSALIKLLSKKFAQPQSLSESLPILTEFCCKNSSMLTDTLLFKCFLGIVCLMVEKQVRESINPPTHCLHKLETILRLISQFMILQDKSRQIARFIFNTTQSLIIFSDHELIPKHFGQYCLNRQSIFIPKMEQISSLTKSIAINQYLEKYIFSDPFYAYILIDKILFWSQIGVNKNKIIQFFRVVIKIINKNQVNGLQETVISKISILIEKQYNHQQNIGEILLEVLLQSTQAIFIERNIQDLAQLGKKQSTERILFFSFSKLIENFFNPLFYNMVIQWYIKLPSFIKRSTLHNFFTMHISHLHQSNEFKIAHTSSDHCEELLDKLLHFKLLDIEKTSFNNLFKMEYLSSSPYVYEAYSSLFLKILTGFGQADQIFQHTVIQVSKYWRQGGKIVQWIEIIQAKTLENKIQSQSLFKNIILLFSLLEAEQIIGIQKPSFHKYFLPKFQQGENVSFVSGVNCILKDKFTTYLLLCYQLLHCLSNSFNYSPSLLNLAHLIEEDPYALNATFSKCSLFITLLLWIYSPKQSNSIIKQILICWSSFFNKYHLEMVFYLFDKENYRKCWENLGIKEPQNIVRKRDIIFSTLILWKDLLNQSIKTPISYLCPFSNCICLMPVRSLKSNSPIEVQFNLVSNFNISHYSFIEFFCTSKQKQNHELKMEYTLRIKNKKLILLDRYRKILRKSKRSIKQQTKGFRIKICSNILEFWEQGEMILAMQFPFFLDCIKIQLFSSIYLSEFKWNQGCSYQLTDQNHQIALEGQIKLKKAKKIKKASIQSKVNYKEFLTLLSQLIKHNQYLQLSGLWKLVFELCVNLITNIKIQRLDKNWTVYFQSLFGVMKNIKPDSKFDLILPSWKTIKGQMRDYGELLAVSFYNKDIFPLFPTSIQKNLVSYLQQLLFSPELSFRFQIERQSHPLYFALIDTAASQKQLESPICFALFKIIRELILIHSTNPSLIQKFRYFFYTSLKKQNNRVEQSFQQLLKVIACSLSLEESESNYHTKVVSKYILEQSNLEELFLVGNLDIKIKILDYLLSTGDAVQRVGALLRTIPDEELGDLIDWILVINKKQLTQLYFFERQNPISIQLIQLFFEALIRCQPLMFQQQRDASLSLSIDFVTYMKKKQRANSLMSDELQKLGCNKYLIIVLVKLILKYQVDEQMERVFIKNFIYDTLEMIFRMPKHILVIGLKYIRNSPENLLIANYILQLNFITTLPLYALSAFLQYLIQIIIMSKLLRDQSQLSQLSKKLTHFIDYIITNYKCVCEIEQPMLYVYPVMEKKVNIEDRSAISNFLKQIQKVGFYELKGGIYFKLLVLLTHLIELSPTIDYSQFIIFLVDKISSKENSQAIYRAVADFIQVSKQTKDRNPVFLQVRNLQFQQQQYSKSNDINLERIRKNQLHIEGNSNQLTYDLTPFFIDYFFMRICIYLQFNCTEKILANSKIRSINQKYSEILCSYLKQFEHISQQLNEKNVSQTLIIEELKDLLEYQGKKNQQQTVAEKVNSVHTGPRSRKGSWHSEVEEPEVPKRINENFEFGSGKKKKIDFLKIASEKVESWSKEGAYLNFHRFFRKQAKQILVEEILHEYYVNSSSKIHVEQEKISNKSKKLSLFIKKFEEYLDEKNKTVEIQKIRIRQIYPFTAKVKSLYKMKVKKLQNQASPWVKLQKQKAKYKLRERLSSWNQVVTEQIPLVSKLNEEESEEEETYKIFQNGQLLVNQEDIGNVCEISNQKGVFYCQWKFHANKITLKSKQGRPWDNSSRNRTFKYGSPQMCLIKCEGKKFTILVDKVRIIFYRKFNQIKHNSLELFFEDGKSIFLIFYTKSRANMFLAQCMKNYDVLKQVKVVQNYVQEFQKMGYSQKWSLGLISNFDYLMLINQYSGRSFSDINQYYVFPWVIQDYKSKKLNLKNPETFRDLRKPMGAVNPAKWQKFEERMMSQSNSQNERYFYGSHYSTSLFILYYLVRLEPFSTLHKQMQGGCWDAADRLFSSLEQMWECLMSDSSLSDIKEAIPQFYYLPTFLTNINKFDFGVKMNGEKVKDVKLPQWSENPTDFIMKMRSALESEYVSLHLNFWIDLIFGSDQCSYEKKNVFLRETYYDKVAVEKIPDDILEGVMSQLTFYGQNPYVLFPKPHCSRKIKIPQFPNNLQTIQKIRLSQNSFIQEMQNYNQIVVLRFYTNLGTKIAKGQSIFFDAFTPLVSQKKTIQKMEGLKQKQFQKDQKQEFLVLDSQLVIKKGATILESRKIGQDFNKTVGNQMGYLIYGGSKIKYFSWGNSLIWEWSSRNEEIVCCSLEGDLVIFGTSRGHIFAADLLNKFCRHIYSYPKPSISLKMLVIRLPSIMPKMFEIIALADSRKITLIHYSHTQI